MFWLLQEVKNIMKNFATQGATAAKDAPGSDLAKAYKYYRELPLRSDLKEPFGLLLLNVICRWATH